MEMSLDHLNALKEELQNRKEVMRSEISERVRTAKEYGDLKENSEYHGARDQQAANEARIDELEQMIKNAQVVADTKTHNSVQYGAVVTVKKTSDNSTRDFTIVGQEEVDVATGRISLASPIGAAMKGRQEGERFSVQTPAGETIYEIISIS